MQENLVHQVVDIWQRKIGLPNVTLLTIQNIVTEWRKLFKSSYGQPDSNGSGRLSDALSIASRTLVEHGYFGAAIQLLTEAWKETGKSQQKSSDKVYRAAIAFYLSETYARRGDRGAAFWWQLHALADDFLGGGDGGGAKIVLETVLGIPQGELFSKLKDGVDEDGTMADVSTLFSELSAIVAENQHVCEQSGWQGQEGFAEDVVVKFAKKHPERASVFAYPTNEVEFPVSPGYLDCLMKNIDQGDKGKNLEFVACYLFLHLPGCTPAHNLTDLQQTWQTDAIIRNLTPQSNLVAETFGRYFAIECKNWAEKVGSPEVGYFLHRIRLLHFNFGAMLARNGITGNPNGREDETAARQLIRRSFHESGTLCIVLSQKHLEMLRDEKTTLRAMLLKEIEEFRFGRP